MSTHLDVKVIEDKISRKVWSVSDFAKRYRLDEIEKNRLVTLLGSFASEQELLMNASRTPRFR